MKFITIANGNRYCEGVVGEFEAENIAQAKKLALGKFDEYHASDEVESIVLFQVSEEWIIDRPKTRKRK